MVHLLSWVHVRFNGATALGAVRRSREAAALRPFVGQGQRSLVSVGNGGVQVKGGRDQVQRERGLVSVGAPCGYCGRALFDST